MISYIIYQRIYCVVVDQLLKMVLNTVPSGEII